LGLLIRDPATMTRLSVFKGIAFIALTAFLLYRLIIRHVQESRQADERIVEFNEALKKHNAELDAERAHWRAAIEGIADEVWICDAQGRMSLVNLPAVTDMGLEEFKDKAIVEIMEVVEILTSDKKPRLPENAPLLRSLRGEIVRGEEIMLHRQTGKQRYRQFSSAPMRDAAGAITGAVAIVRDITNHKQAEETLERLLNRTKLLFDESVKITSQTNLNDLLTAVAKAARELAGARYSAAGHGYVNGKFITGGASRSEGATSCPPGQLFNVERGGVFMDLIEKSESLCLTDAEMRAHPMWWGLPDDHVPMRGLLGSRLIDFQGKPNGMILVSDKEDGSDFSAEDEAALRQLAIIASLALQHIESEESLHQAKEAADAANRAKSQFLANMSHELRTPMAGVLGMLEITLGGPLEAEQREFIRTAHHSAGSLVQILNDILEMTRIEAGMLPIEEKPFSLRDCVSGVVEIFTAEARRKELNLVLSVADNLPKTVIGDQLRLRQVLTNLVGNAFKFTEQGRVEFKVEALSTIPGSWEVTFTVTDTGIGIPDDKKPLIFRPFSQVDESHSRRHGGTGLGLVISKEIVERMGGTIVFVSEEGMGCSFTVTVPFEEMVTAPYSERKDTNPKE
ncbi:MAG TPA: ATP-binding protein, partial [Dongiaceae bacterium]|nr:ATP-binding protein [Dongiaceae bacterium]